MKRVLAPVTVCLLLLSGVRLKTLIVDEWQRDRMSRKQNDLVPADSSLVGIDSSGRIKKPEFGRDGQLAGAGYLLIFVIHRDKATQEIMYWNRVIDSLSELHPALGERMQWWGICDDGAACNVYQSTAKFSILGYLDPYQMRIVAREDAKHEVLLYGPSMRLVARIGRVAEPVVEADLIRQKAR